MENKETEFYCNRVGDDFKHFYRNKMGLEMCGINKKDIVKVKVVEATEEDFTHYAAWSYDDNVFHFVFKTFLEVDICFPDGIKEELELGRFDLCKVKVVFELVTRKKYGDHGNWINDMTEEIDEYLLYRDAYDKCNFRTYLYGYMGEKQMGIRYPGATRGGIYFDDYNTITDISIRTETDGNQCYSPEVDKILNKYIGAKLIFI